MPQTYREAVKRVIFVYFTAFIQHFHLLIDKRTYLARHKSQVDPVHAIYSSFCCYVVMLTLRELTNLHILSIIQHGDNV